ncbi:MAG: hypothetical protein HQK89_06920 [Nitrospirae bacterium]|nr:hypothetical protein [Nitrospirota bacterium]
MANLTSYDGTEGVVENYKGRVVVYLESDFDVEIFKRFFFDEEEFVEFKAPGIVEGDTGGCRKVIKKVKTNQSHSYKVFGIVERDSLLGACKWDIFWERNDEVFLQSRPFGDKVRVLTRWEIENYLIEPEELERFLFDYVTKLPNVLSELLSHCDVLVPVMAANILLHIRKKGALDDDYCNDTNKRTEAEQKVRESLRKKLNDDDINDFEDYIKKFDSFFNVGTDDDNSNESIRKWRNYSKLIDGKRILGRIKHSIKLRDDHRLALATRIKSNNKVESELVNYIKEFKGEVFNN